MPQGRQHQIKTHPAPQGGYFVLTTDGAIEPKRGRRPRAAAIGVVLRTPNGVSSLRNRSVLKRHRDPPEAEHKALIRGLDLAQRFGIGRLRAYVDSALVVNQLNGTATVKAEHLKPLCLRAKKLLGQADILVSWIPRAWNAEADLLAAKALDAVRD